MTGNDNILDIFGALLRHVKQPAMVCKITGDIVYMNDDAKILFGDGSFKLTRLFSKTDYLKVLEYSGNKNKNGEHPSFTARSVGPDKRNVEFIYETCPVEVLADFVLIGNEIEKQHSIPKIHIDLQKVYTSITDAINESSTIDVLIQHVLSILKDYFVDAEVSISYKAHEAEEAALLCSSDFEPTLPVKELAALVAKAQVPVFLRKNQISDLLDQQQSGGSKKPLVFCGVPLSTKSKAIGSVGLYHYNAPGKVSKQDLAILELLADQLFFAFEYKLSELNLVKAKQKAEQSDNLKTSFLANMSHEIRTPMNSIVGFGGLLLSDHVSESDKAYYYKQIKESSTFLMQLIDDIIDVSRIESGDTTISKSDFNFHHLVTELFSQHKQLLADANKLHLEFKVYKPDAGGMMVLSDQKRIRQVFKNLLSNAIKFTDKGFIEFGYEMLDDGMIQCFVKDTGIGIREEDMPFVFNSFTKVNSSSTRIFGGTGIGLTICKQVVEMLGGRIWADSTVNLGTTFFFTFPIEKSKKMPAVAKDISKQEINSLLKQQKVLIAEDNESNYELLSSMLRHTGADILPAQDGFQAIKFLENNPDTRLLLLDIRMPGMDGYQVARRIREFNKEVRIIAQTAYAFEADRIEALTAGCNEFIVKPIKQQELYNKIYHLFYSGS